MGCASSNSIKVREAATTSANLFKEDSEQNNSRIISATSKHSTHSTDSGYTDVTDTPSSTNDYITEFSNETKRLEIENDFKENPDLELTLNGKQCEQRISAKNRKIREENKALDMLLSEGLMQRPISRVGRSVRFDIVESGDSTNATEEKRPFQQITNRPTGFRRPQRLEKLKMPTNRSLNASDINDKLEKANTRRLELQQERLLSIQKTTGLLDEFAKRQAITISSSELVPNRDISDL